MRLVGLALLLIPLFTRAMSTLSMLPGWDLDPLIMPSPFTGVGPAESMTFDCIALLGAAILAVFAPRNPGRSDWLVIALLTAGAAGVLAHMSAWTGLSGAGGLGDRRIGIAWLSAMLGATAIWLCRRDESLRRIAAASLVGFVAVLALKGAQQVWIEHAQTVAQYRADPGRFLAGQGLLPGTPMARAFERRLLQSEATGWFGLSNVYATVVAGAAVTLVGLLSLGVRHSASHGRIHRVIIGATAAVALTALFATHSKGGALAAAVGGVALFLAAFASQPHMVRRLSMNGKDVRARLGALFGLTAVLGPIALIIIRGLIGERMGELSLLFRWFYMQGAARIFAWHPLGVGPDGFQQAYLLAKPPISPEEVTSPHSITFDWLGDLGVFGFGWIVLLLIAAAAAGRVLVSGANATAPLVAAQSATTNAPASDPTVRTEARLILLIPGLATLLAAWLERGAVTPDAALVRLIGLFAWCAAAWGVLNIARAVSAWPIAMAAGAAAILAHSQIDVAASWPQSAGLVAIWVAISCSESGPLTTSSDAAPSMQPRLRVHAGLIITILGCLAIALSAPSRVWRWQDNLLAAKDQLTDVAELNGKFANLAGAVSQEDFAAIAAELAKALSRRTGSNVPPSQTLEHLRSDMAVLEEMALQAAATSLSAIAVEPSEWRVRREASRLLLRAASAADATGNSPGADKLVVAAIDAMVLPLPSSPSTDPPGSASEWRWVAIVFLQAAAQFRDESWKRMWLTEAASALERAAALDPYNLEIALRLMRVYGQLADDPKAASSAKAWANKVLELDPLMRLDKETRGLTDSERAEAEDTLRRP